MERGQIITVPIQYDRVDLDEMGQDSISSQVREILSGSNWDSGGLRIWSGDKVFGPSVSTLRTIIYREAGILGIKIRTTEVDGAVIVFKRNINGR